MVKISIIVPIYNSEKYLDECLESLTNQTFKDIEIICINNESKDSSLEILNRWKAKDDRIVIKTIENHLVGNARNIGISMAQGEFIGFIDSDDWIDADYYEKLYDAICKHNADMSCCSIIRKRQHHQKYRLHFIKEEVFTNIQDKIRVLNIPKMSYTVNKLYRKSSLLKSNVWFETEVFFEDVFYNFQVIYHLEKLVTVPNINYYYRVNPKSIVKTHSEKKDLDKANAYKNVRNFAKSHDIKLSEKDKIVKKEWHKLLGIPLYRTIYWEDYKKHYLFGIIKL